MPPWFKKPREQDEAPALQEPSTAPAPRVPLFIARKPREGFLEYGDRLYPETVRVGDTTFARKREPGQRHGALRAPEE